MAACFAIFKEDLKGLLAYSTISHLGLIVCLLGIGSPLAVAAAIFHIINHATFKAALFMIAGIIDHETGTRDLTKIKWDLATITVYRHTDYDHSGIHGRCSSDQWLYF
jgi:multicomponent K+:H+ antiporter subunit A